MIISEDVLMTVYLPVLLAKFHTASAQIKIQLDDMRMSQQLQIFDFPLHPPRHISRDELLPRDNLQGNLLVRNPVHGELDLAEAALAQCSEDMVGADTLFCLLLNRLLNSSMVAGWVATSGSIGRFVLSPTVR